MNYKYSVQYYDANCIEFITDTINAIYSGYIPYVKCINCVTIFERGKRRIITPIDISDRITQKVLCDRILIPAICPHLVFDNGASMKGKGTDFARKRVNSFIESAKREYGGQNLYALVFDFKSYFDSIPHAQCYRVLKKYICDERLVDLTIGIIESYKLRDINTIEDEEQRKKALERLRNHEEVGICLGSQISQVMAVAVPNEFDHYIKDVLKLKYYERYMDDGVIILNSKSKLRKIKKILGELAQEYGLKFNEAKTYVVKLTKGFTFLKIKYQIIDDGKTVKRLVRSGIVRERRKLKRFKGKVVEGEMSVNDVYNNIQSWLAHSKLAKCHVTVKHMLELYNDYFGGYKITQKYYRNNSDVIRKRKVVRI